MPCLLSVPLPWTPFSRSLSFSELPSSSVCFSAADQVRAVQSSCSALCSCHHPTSINNFSPALKGKYYYSKHVTRQDKHTLLPSPSEGPTLCFLLYVSAGVVFSPPCLAHHQLRHGAARGHASWLCSAYGVPEVHPALPGHPNSANAPRAPLHARGCSSILFPLRHIPLVMTKAGGRAAKPPLQPLCAPHPAFPPCHR